jgi:fructose-1,6-bisphosphatase/inositol monophosphatase family enzyme
VPADPIDLVRLAERLARTVGQEIVRRRADGLVEVTTKSSTTDMVTEVDRAAEHLIVEALREARPADGIIGEEGAARDGTSGIRWLVDPIDGTTNFLYGLPGWAVSIAAVDDDGPVAGAVSVPTFAELFSGARGHGAHLDGRVIHCSAKADLATALVGTGFSYQRERRVDQGAIMAALLPHVRDVRRFGAASVDLCSVAAGRLDVYYEEGLAPWDLAAGEVIAREAGAVLSDTTGGPVRAGSVVVCPPQLHQPFLDLLATVGMAG